MFEFLWKNHLLRKPLYFTADKHKGPAEHSVISYIIPFDKFQRGKGVRGVLTQDSLRQTELPLTSKGIAQEFYKFTLNQTRQYITFNMAAWEPL